MAGLRGFTQSNRLTGADISLAGGKFLNHPNMDPGFRNMLNAETHLVIAAPNSTLGMSLGQPVSTGIAANDFT